MRCKVVKFSELGDSWLPSDHILEAQLDDLVEELKKRQAALRQAVLKAVKLREDITALTVRISSEKTQAKPMMAHAEKT